MAIAMSAFPDVSTESSERAAMSRDLELISQIREGAEAVRRNSARYLPKYEMESADEYRRRVLMAPWRPEFVDTLRFLASKPFARDVTVAEDTPEPLSGLVEDIDGGGNNLTQFARHAFTEAIANGMHAILVDYPSLGDVAARPISKAEERALGVRPYWVHVAVTDIIALRTQVVNGRQIVTHLRFKADVIEPDGFGEKRLEQIRVIEPDRWEIWQRSSATNVWAKIAEGLIRFAGGKTPDQVLVALLFTGERLGQLQTRPALRDLAEVQIELYRALSRQDEILTYTGSPMLAAVGMQKPPDGAAIEVGPKTILFAPAVGDGAQARWEFISPDASALGEIRQHIGSIVEDMHRLGLQPTTTRSGSLTATMASITASKAHTVLEAWAVGLKDCLEQAYRFTARFLNLDHATTVQVFTDFAVGDQNAEQSRLVLDVAKAGVVSKRTTREELQRRNIFGPQFEPAAETARLAAEQGEVQPDQILEKINIDEPVTDVEPGVIGPAKQNGSKRRARGAAAR